MSVLAALALSLSLATQDGALADGEARLEAGDARGAMIRFEQAVRADPSDAEARRLLAEALLLLSEADRAEKMARASRRGGGGDAAALIHAEALIALDRFAEAEDAAGAASASPRRDALLALARAERALAAGEPEDALGLLATAVRDGRLRTRAELVAARAQYARGDLVRARRLTERVLADDDGSFDALLLRARLALRAGDTGRAAALADDILDLDPGNVSAGAVAIEAALRRGEVSRARERHRALRPLDDADPRPAYLAALIALAEDDPRRAGDAIAGIEPWLQTVDGGAVLIARVRAANGRLAQAERTLRDRLRTYPRDAAARAVLVDVLDRAGKRGEGDALLDEGLAMEPGERQLVTRQAERLMQAGRLDEATQLLAQRDVARAELTAALGQAGGGLTTASGEAETLLAAYAALRRGEGRDAMQAARAAVAASERSPVALNLLAAAQAAAGDETAAQRTLDEAIAADPDYLAAIANRASLSRADDALLRGLREARAAGAASPAVMTALATEAWVHGAPDEAEAALRAAGGDAGARLMLARLQHLTGGDPLPTLTALLDGHPDDAAVVVPAAALLEARGQAGRAAPTLDRLARRHDDPGLALAAASAWDAAGEAAQAVRRLRAARRSLPGHPGLAEALIAATVRAGAQDGPVQALQADLVAAGALSAAEAEAARLEATGQRAAAARALLAETGAPRSLLKAAALATDEADRKAVIAALGDLAAARPGDAALLLGLGGARLDAGDTAGADAAWREALAARPGDPIILNNLADLRGRAAPAEGLPLARDAYAAAPNNPAIAQTYARLLAATGDAPRARRVLRRARLAAPADAGLAAALEAAGG